MSERLTDEQVASMTVVHEIPDDESPLTLRDTTRGDQITGAHVEALAAEVQQARAKARERTYGPADVQAAVQHVAYAYEAALIEVVGNGTIAESVARAIVKRAGDAWDAIENARSKEPPDTNRPPSS